MRPILKSYAYFDRHPEGVFFRLGSETFILKGPDFYPIVAKLLALLDGQRDVSEIEQRLPEKVRPLFATLLRELLQRGYVVDLGMDPSLPAHDLEARSGTLLQYLADHGANPSSKYAKWVSGSYLIAGHGDVFRSVIEALIELGAEILACYLDCEDSQTEVFLSKLSATKKGVTKIEGLSYQDRPAGELAIYAADTLKAIENDQDFLEAVNPVTVTLGLRDEVFLLPAAKVSYFRQNLNASPKSQTLKVELPSTSQLTVAGKVAAFDFFRRCCNIGQDKTDALGICIGTDLSQRTFPLDREAYEARPTALYHPKRDLTAFEKIRSDLQSLFDPVTGLFSAVENNNLHHLPLHHYQVQLNARADFYAHETLLGWGMKYEDAFRRAVCRAAQRYIAHHCPDDIACLPIVGFGEAQVAQTGCNLSIYSRINGSASRVEIDCYSVNLGVEGAILWRLVRELEKREWTLFQINHPELIETVVEIELDGQSFGILSAKTLADAAVEVFGSLCSVLQQRDETSPFAFARKMEPQSEISLEVQRELAQFGLYSAILAEQSSVHS